MTRLRKNTCCIRGMFDPESLTIVAIATKDADDSIIDNIAFKLYFCDILLILSVIMRLLYNIVLILQALNSFNLASVERRMYNNHVDL